MMSVQFALVLLLQIYISEPVLTTYRYNRRFPSSNLCNIEIIKYFAEIIRRSTTARLDKMLNRPTVKLIWNKVRKFISAQECKTNLLIPKEVYNLILNWGEFGALLHCVILKNNSNNNTPVSSRSGLPAVNKLRIPLIEGREKSPTAVTE